jgi:CDP-glycerol glycerophosphotransferase (TagB/SpsB family)
MTSIEEIYDEFCENDTHCSKIIAIDRYSYQIDGNFLEKYLDIILKLKAVISASEFYSFENIFYNIEYLTYIMMGHGVSFFKRYLYNDYLSPNKYNKITAPPSKIIIDIAKQYGWKEEDIIKVGRPKWDLYDEYEKNNKNKTEKSIFLMFTWRKLQKGKKIARDYLNKAVQLLQNKRLNNALRKNNIILYFIFHHMLNFIKVKKVNLPNLKLIQQSQISEHLIESDLIITDFSSIIFEVMHRRKPYIMFIPDANDPFINNNYIPEYFDIINELKNDSIPFENKYFEVDEVVDKIIYYIDNNFELEDSLKEFYDSFELNCTNNTQKFVEYLVNLK